MSAQQQFDGFVKDGRILVWPDAWHRLWAGLDADDVKEHLRRAGSLIPGSGGGIPSLEKFKSKAPPARFYVLAKAFLEPA
jgi:hypothetical protein